MGILRAFFSLMFTMCKLLTVLCLRTVFPGMQGSVGLSRTTESADPLDHSEPRE